MARRIRRPGAAPRAHRRAQPVRGLDGRAGHLADRCRRCRSCRPGTVASTSTARGTFTTQKSWLWCTAADVQIIRNIVEGASDHTTSGQRRYFDWMRDHNKYSLPESAGVDPQGWTAGLRQFVDDRYRLVASKSFDIALASAVTNLRRTNLPVAVTVAHGDTAGC